MAANFKVLVILLMTLMLELGSCDLSCAQGMDTCVKPLGAMNLSRPGVIPNYSKEVMDKLCKIYGGEDGVEGCLGKIEHLCNSTERLHMKVIDNQFDYICDKTYDPDVIAEYLQHRECLATPALHKDVASCDASLAQQVTDLQHSSWSTTDRSKRLCQYSNAYIECVYSHVTGYCDTAAAEWQRNLDMLTALPVLALIDCDFYHQRGSVQTNPAPHSSADDSETKIIIAAVVVIGGVCILLAAGMTAFYISRRKRSERAKAAREMMTRTRRDTTDHHNRPSDGGAGALGPPPELSPSVLFAPPPYLEKGAPPPSYRGPPSYDLSNDLGATGVSYGINPIPEKK